MDFLTHASKGLEALPSRPLSFDTAALISLEATPYRMLVMEKATEEAIIIELQAAASEWPRRTKQEVRRYGRGMPKLRTDLIAIALGRTLWQLREHTTRDAGQDIYFYGERARLLRLAGDAAGGLDEAIVKEHEWPA